MLANLPCRGTLVAPAPGAVISRSPPTYVCAHETEPPDDQVVTTDPTHILIRSQQNKKKAEQRAKQERGKGVDKGKGAAADKGKGAAADRGKRPAAAAPAEQPAGTKRQHTEGAGTSKSAEEAGPSGSGTAARSVRYTVQQLQAKTNKDLADLLKSRGQAARGRKEDLVKRILDLQEREQKASKPHG
ncbi:hypothetical protein WJX72_002364 [[Myrmecia] bisecta]|uniref:SAP domain-containing protein n=1 Tax=[Myrmecia] bisecta TaxID=41462 RepID=A0AAW1P938_9CHLO